MIVPIDVRYFSSDGEGGEGYVIYFEVTGFEIQAFIGKESDYGLGARIDMDKAITLMKAGGRQETILK